MHLSYNKWGRNDFDNQIVPNSGCNGAISVIAGNRKTIKRGKFSRIYELVTGVFETIAKNIQKQEKNH